MILSRSWVITGKGAHGAPPKVYVRWIFLVVVNPLTQDCLRQDTNVKNDRPILKDFPIVVCLLVRYEQGNFRCPAGYLFLRITPFDGHPRSSKVETNFIQGIVGCTLPTYPSGKSLSPIASGYLWVRIPKNPERTQ